MGKIAVIGTLDTKESEALFLREQLESLGHEVTVMDMSCCAITLKNLERIQMPDPLLIKPLHISFPTFTRYDGNNVKEGVRDEN